MYVNMRTSQSMINYMMIILEEKEKLIYHDMQMCISSIDVDNVYDLHKFDVYYALAAKWLHVTRVLNKMIILQE